MFTNEWTLQATQNIASSADIPTLENWRIFYLGKKSELKIAQQSLPHLPAAERKARAQQLQQARNTIEEALRRRTKNLKATALAQRLEAERIDTSLPAYPEHEPGLHHPISKTIEEIEEIFGAMGFVSLTGPEIEHEYYNFDALNIPDHHPARTSQDTFWIAPHLLLRSQTSNVQIRHMSSKKPPYRIISPGGGADGRYNHEF